MKMSDYKKDIIQIIIGGNERWNNYQYIDATNGLDNAEYRRRLEKIVQYPASANVHGYVESIIGEIGEITPTPASRIDFAHLREIYLQEIYTNHTENYIRDVISLNGFSIKDLKLVQFSKDVYLSSSFNETIDIDLTPIVHLTNTGDNSLEPPVVDTTPLNHLVNEPIVYEPVPAELTEPTEKLIHLTTEEVEDNYTEIINVIEKAVSEQKSIDSILEPVYEPPKEVLYQPNPVDESTITTVEPPITQLEKEDQRKIEETKERKLTNRLKETILSSSVNEEPTIRVPEGTVLRPLDHWRGRISDTDRGPLYRDSKLMEFRNNHWYEVNEDAPTQGPRRRVYEYYDEQNRRWDYMYLNSANSATRMISTDRNHLKKDHKYEPEHRGTIDDLFDNADNAYLSTDGRPTDEGKLQSDGQLKFQGGRTPLYLNNERDKRQISEQPDGLLRKEQERFNRSYNDLRDTNDANREEFPARPLSAMDPFTRVGSRDDKHKDEVLQIPQYANSFSYNRTRIPIAEIEWRKGFRYLFITRPECYIMTTSNVLSSQCMNDETFYTSWCRLPHISYLLSPSYITCTDKSHWTYHDNFNYLLTNRVMNMSTVGTEMDQLQSIQKSTNGASVTPGTTINNDYGGNLNLTFRDTKDLEVYECLRLWMRYIHKIYSGTFASSYNHYSYYNTYGDLVESDSEGNGSDVNYNTMNKIHPYDRALDYCATIFDIVTNEAGTKIVYWCKYIGVYPMSATQTGLTDAMNKALDNEQTVSARFYYQGKEEYKMKSLVEFNYNAGLLDSLGHTMQTAKWAVSHPYLVRQSTNPDKLGYVSPNSLKMDYIGPAGMFVGRPYCVLRKGLNRIMPNGTARNIIVPQLRFMPIQDDKLNRYMNGNIVNEENTTPNVVRITQ